MILSQFAQAQLFQCFQSVFFLVVYLFLSLLLVGSFVFLAFLALVVAFSYFVPHSFLVYNEYIVRNACTSFVLRYHPQLFRSGLDLVRKSVYMIVHLCFGIITMFVATFLWRSQIAHGMFIVTLMVASVRATSQSLISFIRLFYLLYALSLEYVFYYKYLCYFACFKKKHICLFADVHTLYVWLRSQGLEWRRVLLSTVFTRV